jgi:hypothetical protein
MIVLLSVTAFSLDWGQSVMAAQYAQDVADAAALAAGQYDVSDQTDAKTNITNIVAANNANRSPGVTWSAGTTYFYASGTTVPKWGTLPSGQEAVKVYISVPVKYYFAPIIGLKGTTVTRYATALRVPGEPWGDIFSAGLPTSALHGVGFTGSNGGVHNGNIWSNAEITMGGSGHTVNGYAHADSSFGVTGSSQTVTGRSEYVTTWSLSGSSNSFNPVQVASAPRSFPVTYNVNSDFGTYTYDVPSYSLTGSNNTVPPGIYRVHGNVSITGSSQKMPGVTFVADGTISITGSNAGPGSPAAANGVFCYSLSTNQYAIDIAGGTGTWSGLLYAPNGGVRFTGSSQVIKNGSLWGQTVSSAGSGWTCYPTAGYWGTSTISLIQ